MVSGRRDAEKSRAWRMVRTGGKFLPVPVYYVFPTDEGVEVWEGNCKDAQNRIYKGREGGAVALLVELWDRLGAYEVKMFDTG